MQRILSFARLSIYLGPSAFVVGSLLTLGAWLCRQPQLLFLGLCLAASSLIVWGCHGVRRRGMRPGFVAMAFCGSAFLLLHLNYRLSDYRWAQINSMTLGAAPATTGYLEERITLIACILITSLILGLLPPLPETTRPPSPLRALRR